MMSNEALYDLAHAGDVQGVNQWINQHPHDLNAPVGEGYSALHVACMFGHEELMHHLVEREALININAANTSGATPLHMAVNFRDEKIAERMALYLIDRGAELNAAQIGGQTPLHHAVARDSGLLVKSLVEAGADPFLKDEQGRSAADLAKTLNLENGEMIREALKKAFKI